MVLTEAAYQAAGNGGDVYFINMLDPGVEKGEPSEDNIFDVAMELTFASSSIEVVTIGKMRRELGRRGEENGFSLLTDFLEKRGGLATAKVLSLYSLV